MACPWCICANRLSIAPPPHIQNLLTCVKLHLALAHALQPAAPEEEEDTQSKAVSRKSDTWCV